MISACKDWKTIVWLEDMWHKHMPADGKIMHEKVLSLYDHCCEGIMESERKKYTTSKGWLASYVKSNILKNVKITGESASTDDEAALRSQNSSRTS